MKVATIQSLDSGVGFLVSVDGLTFFHAGDHACLTKDDQPVYDAEIDYLEAIEPQIDIAFLPVSGCPSRWKIDSVKEGFANTVKRLNPKVVLPMHGLNNEQNYLAFAELAKEKGLPAKVICVEHPGDAYHHKTMQTNVALN